MSNIEPISENRNEQLQRNIVRCVTFSLQLDESTDITDNAQLLVFIPMVFENFKTKEELLSMCHQISKLVVLMDIHRIRKYISGNRFLTINMQI